MGLKVVLRNIVRLMMGLFRGELHLREICGFAQNLFKIAILIFSNFTEEMKERERQN
jgi:hypothetical protein